MSFDFIAKWRYLQKSINESVLKYDKVIISYSQYNLYFLLVQKIVQSTKMVNLQILSSDSFIRWLVEVQEYEDRWSTNWKLKYTI